MTLMSPNLDNWTPRLWQSLVAALLSGAAYYLSTGLDSNWLLAWVAPLPVLFVAFRETWWRAALASFLAFALGQLNLFDYLLTLNNSPSPAGAIRLLVIFASLFGLGFAGVVLLARLAVRRLPPWLGLFAFPSVWTAYDYLFSSNAYLGTLFSTAYSQAGVLPVLQLASLTGIWGIVFLLALVPSALAVPWRGGRLVCLAPALGLVLAVIAFGGFRLTEKSATRAVTIGVISDDAAGYAEGVVSARPTVAAYLVRVESAARRGAKIIVLPEKIVGAAAADLAELEQGYQDAARRAGVTIVAGWSEASTPLKRNVAVAYGSDGGKTRYAKRHFAPGERGRYQAGSGAASLIAANTRLGLAICKDYDFPSSMRDYGKLDVRIMAAPAWDFGIDGWLHARIALVRGVENGYAVARSARDGKVLLSDAYGRIVAEGDSAKGAEVVAALAPGPGATAYAKLGDWFGWLCVGASVLMVGASLFIRNRGRLS